VHDVQLRQKFRVAQHFQRCDKSHQINSALAAEIRRFFHPPNCLISKSMQAQKKGHDSRRGPFCIRVNPWLKILNAFPRPSRRVRHDPVRLHQAVHRARRVHDPDHHHRQAVHRVRHGLRHADGLHADDHRY
jgi:hypothetical protein